MDLGSDKTELCERWSRGATSCLIVGWKHERLSARVLAVDWHGSGRTGCLIRRGDNLLSVVVDGTGLSLESALSWVVVRHVADARHPP